MKSAGQILKETRKINNIDINFISKELNISTNKLIDIEEDNLDNNSDFVFNIGHLKSYSIFLGLDEKIIIKKFKEQNEFKSSDVTDKLPRPSFNNNYFSLNYVFSLTAIITIFSSFYFLFIDKKINEKEYALIPQIPEIYEPIIEKESLELDDKKNTDKDIITKNILPNDYLATSAVASTRIEKMDDGVVTLKFLNSTWFQLRDQNNNIIISKLMEKNEEYNYKLSEKYTVTAGNAGNIVVLIDNNVRGKIGKIGEVVDTLYIDKNFNN